jgi:hypothetical protein
MSRPDDKVKRPRTEKDDIERSLENAFVKLPVSLVKIPFQTGHKF